MRLQDYIQKYLLRSDGNINSAFIKTDKWKLSKEKLEIEKLTNHLGLSFIGKLDFLLGKLQLKKCLNCETIVTNSKGNNNRTPNKFCSKSCACSYNKDKKIITEKVNTNHKIKNFKHISGYTLQELVLILSLKPKYIKIVNFCIDTYIYNDIKLISKNNSFSDGLKIVQQKSDKELYSSLVMKYTKQNKPKTNKIIGLCGKDNAYQLDHKFSIVEGFKAGILPHIIGSKENLEYIPWKENLSKGTDCSITIEELCDGYINQEKVLIEENEKQNNKIKYTDESKLCTTKENLILFRINKNSTLLKLKDENDDFIFAHFSYFNNKRRKYKKRINNSAGKNIQIFNANGVLMYNCICNFRDICKKNNLPHKVLKESYQNKGRPIYNGIINNANKENVKKYKGWYAIDYGYHKKNK